MAVITIMPEGWAFFTKDPRGYTFLVFKKVYDKWERVNIPGSSLKYFFGLNRKGRAIGPEMSQLIMQVPDSLWKPIKRSLGEYLGKTPDKIDIKIDSLYHVKDRCPQPQCLGEICIQKVMITPWTWAKSDRKIIMPSFVVTLYVIDSKEN